MSESKKISSLQELSQEEVKDALISGLRSRPNSTSIYGAPGMTANELKKQYDKYPEKLRGKLNELIEVLKERFSIDKNGITPVANDIYVKIADDTIATLSSAIVGLDRTDREMSFDISQLSVKADNALQTAERASTVANEAHSFAEGAMSLSGGALGIANESKEIASDAYSYARTAEQVSAQAISLAENAENSSKNALSIAKEARKEADDASSIAKGANQAKTFDTKAQMEYYVKGLYGFYVGQELKKGSTIIMSQGGHIEEIEYGRIICDFTLVATNASTGEQSTIFREEFADYTGEINGKYYSLYTVPFDLIVDEFYGSFYMYNGSDHSYFDGAKRFAVIKRAKEDLNAYWLERLTESIIPIGTNLYIRDVGVPDYWWDGGRAFELETQKVDLKDYAKTEDVKEGLQLILDAVNGILEGGASA